MHAFWHVDVFGITAGEQDWQRGTQFTGLISQFPAVHDRQANIGHHQINVLARVL
ncbi:hypothetical protein D9M71_766470 [compost metagenome]